jgi:hypothetical protein
MLIGVGGGGTISWGISTNLLRKHQDINVRKWGEQTEVYIRMERSQRWHFVTETKLIGFLKTHRFLISTFLLMREGRRNNASIHAFISQKCSLNCVWDHRTWNGVSKCPLNYSTVMYRFHIFFWILWAVFVRTVCYYTRLALVSGLTEGVWEQGARENIWT